GPGRGRDADGGRGSSGITHAADGAWVLGVKAMFRMMRSRIPLLLAVTLSFAAAGCNKLQARDQLNKGVQAFKAGRFEVAEENFKKAKELDPELKNAQLFLATTYVSQYIPGAPSEDNVKKGEAAIAEFEEVLKKDPNNLSAIDGIGSILYNMGGTPYDPKKLERSKEFHTRHIRIKPDDADPYYWMGVIDWTLSFRANNQMRAEYNAANNKQIKDIDPLPPKVRESFKEYFVATVDEGIQHLEKAIQLKPDYDAAYAYLNLLYRQKADMAEKEEREQYLTKADELVEQFKVIKQRKLEQAAKQPAS
ncbi:MAG: tetratricopeptide repeat protein, partial [Gammaproteobacteria bacterium]